MPTVGEQLRQAREARKLRVREVAESTNMRSDHIIALEEGNYALFPAPVYIRGSVRTYAKLLKLEVMPLMRTLEAELKQATAPQESSRTFVPHGGLLKFVTYQFASFGWKQSLTVLILLLLAVAFWVSRILTATPSDPEPLTDIPPPRYQPVSSDDAILPLPRHAP